MNPMPHTFEAGAVPLSYSPSPEFWFLTDTDCVTTTHFIMSVHHGFPVMVVCFIMYDCIVVNLFSC